MFLQTFIYSGFKSFFKLGFVHVLKKFYHTNKLLIFGFLMIMANANVEPEYTKEKEKELAELSDSSDEGSDTDEE